MFHALLIQAKQLLLFSCLLVFCSSCSERIMHYDVYGADEFILDSYTIRQGKFAILEMEGKEAGECIQEALDVCGDVIMEGDILNIFIHHPTRSEISSNLAKISETIGFRVEQGAIQLPTLPPIDVRGLTLQEAQSCFREAFSNQHVDVNVFITYKDRMTHKVELTGQVAIPFVAINGTKRLYEVLAEAKVPPQANLFMSYVVRDGKQLAVDLHKLIYEGDLTQNIVMRGGDKVFIADGAQSRVMVMGEVGHPRAINVPFGFVSLREALVEAGGIPFTGNRNQIQVIRGNLLCPKIYVLSWRHITHLPNDSLLLMPGDTVYVSETPITKWNHFISQLLPSLSMVTQCNGCYNCLGF